MLRAKIYSFPFERIISKNLGFFSYVSFFKYEQELTIPEGIQSIGEYAISDMDKLKTLNLPSSLKSIQQYGISKYKLYSLSISNTCSAIQFLNTTSIFSSVSISYIM